MNHGSYTERTRGGEAQKGMRKENQQVAASVQEREAKDIGREKLCSIQKQGIEGI